MTKSIATFIAKDFHLYSVVGNRGFRALLHTMKLRSNILSHWHFTDTAVPTLDSETKMKVMASVVKAGRIAVTYIACTSLATTSYITKTALK